MRVHVEEWTALRLSHEPPWGGDLVRHYLRDLVYGANDGIITTFAVVSGVAGAALEARTALIPGVANLLADGFSMGASNFLSIRSEGAVLVTRGEAAREPFPARHGGATFAAFVVAGSIPLLPYALASEAWRFEVATAATLATLFLVGGLRALVTEMCWWIAGGEMLLAGAAAAAISFGIGALLKAFF